MGFFKNIIKKLIDDGNTVDIATNNTVSPVPDCYKEWGCNVFTISTSRSPFSLGNIKAIKQIRKLSDKYDIVHCHTPLAGMATRLACRRLRKKGKLKVIYTAHGFHFYKGAPFKNWLIYYPIEKFCSHWTDTLITINKEDYALAQKKMRAKQVVYIPGVGIDTHFFKDAYVDVNSKRKQLGVPTDSKIVLSVGELNENKNHQSVIRAIGELKNKDIYYLIAGVGEEEKELIALAESLNVNLRLLGYRKDVLELYKSANLFVLPSIREGLNVSMMEAISSSCPTIVSKIRGNVDIVPEEYCFAPNDIKSIATLVSKDDYDMSKYSYIPDCKDIYESIEKIYLNNSL